jgi:hypothetical protein
MPTYKVLIEGSGFELQLPSGEAAQGFFVARTVVAASEKEAASKGLRLVEEEWSSGEQSSLKVTPRLSISEVELLRAAEANPGERSGYAFHLG